MTGEPPIPGLDDPLIVAHMDLIRRTGARTVQVRYSDDEKPVVWMAVSEHRLREGGYGHEAAAAMTPMDALGRLADQLIDGGSCAHCARPAGVWRDWAETPPMSGAVCWYVYDPELKKLRYVAAMDRAAGEALLAQDPTWRGTAPPIVQELVLRLLTGQGRDGQPVTVGGLSDHDGVFGYAAGASGTPDLPDDAQVVSVAFSGGTLKVNGGPAIPGDFAADIPGELVEPTLLFAGTSQYVVFYVTPKG